MFKIKDKTISSSYLLEEYFPIKIQFGNYDMESRKNNVRIDYDDSNALELMFNKESPKEIAELNLLVSNKYNIINDTLIIPHNITNCSISATKSEKYKANDFIINVYNNAVELKFEKDIIKQSVLCGNIIFNFSNDLKIISIILTNISDELHNHIVTELKYNK